MNTKTLTKEQRLDYFKTLYRSARDAYSESLMLFDKYMRQYKGSTEIDGSSERASTTRNITYEIIESQVWSEIPIPKVDTVAYSEKRERSAEVIEKLCAAAKSRLPFEEINDIDERFTYIYGGSVIFVEWDNTVKEGAEIGSVMVHSISPTDFTPEPGVFSIDNMEYCFIRFLTTRAEIMRKYGVNDADCMLAQCEAEDEDFTERDTVSVILAFYKGEDGSIGQFVYSGDLVLRDLEDYYSRKICTCKSCGEDISLCRCESPKPFMKNQDYEHISSPDGGHSLSVPYYKPRHFPIVIRKNTSGEKSLFGQSDCEYIRPEQQAINKIETRILQKLLRSGVTPIVPEDASITVNNSVFGQVIKMKPGESMAQYGTVDTTPDISQDIAEAERLYDHAKRTLGISDAFQGTDEYANESGYARQLRISQASGRLESKKKMKHTAYAKIYKIIFEHYLAFADEPRVLSYKDSFGRIHNRSFNRYDFLAYDTACGCYYYDDAFLFSTDPNGGSQLQREALWEKNLENLKSGTLGDPSLPSTLLRYWQFQERAHYPNARENVEYFLEMTKGGELYGSKKAYD